MKILIVLFMTLLSIPAFAQEKLMPVTSYDEGLMHIDKFIDPDKTECQNNICNTVDISIISDSEKGREPGKYRSMFVAIIKFDLSDHTAVFLSISQFDIVNNVPELKGVLGDKEHPASNKWISITPENHMTDVIKLLTEHYKEFENQEVN